MDIMENCRTLNQSSTQLTRSPTERVQALKTILTHTKTLKENINNTAIHTLQKCMQEVDDINLESKLEEKIYHSDEVLLDSALMRISSNTIMYWTRSAGKSMQSYNYIEFAEKLKEYVQRYSESETLDWSILTQKVTKYFHSTPEYVTLLGTLLPADKKEKVEKKRQPIIREANAPIKRPENVISVNKEENTVDETVQTIQKFLSQYYKTHKTPLDFFRLILHPTDFGKTIENILHISFLVRDGVVELTKDNSGRLIILLCSKEKSIKAKKAESNKNVQNLVALNMEQWKILIDEYRLQQPMINFN